MAEYSVEYGKTESGAFASDTFIAESIEECAKALVADRANCSKKFLWDYATVECDGEFFMVDPSGVYEAI